ncbi:siderophore-interacting protein [Streptomyces sp. WMMC500]|uniref:siderophore-interacting protein n=1 Tax=Streptomyces sp. WMMC500 TaxID=3015154 RepID=UPI00248AD6A8|nr:siderophore-interacting protein [Streptomyces sp. WMMC500]WBB59188.1 siderophore-interacting protein [Streptomyces sp. WMMC500]
MTTEPTAQTREPAADTAPAEPFRFFRLDVTRTERLSPTLLRVTFGDDGSGSLDGFASGGCDQSLSLFLPHPGQAEPVMPTGPDWFDEYRALDPDVRAVLRSYTVRAQRPGEVDIDFVLHTDPAGPAARWASGAEPGDRIIALGPAVPDNTGVRFRLPAGADHVVVAADETALPAAAAILESLPAGLPAKAWIRVPHPGDALKLDTPADVEITWLTGPTAGVVDALRAAELPAGTPYAWLAGEAGMVRELRRQLVRERKFDRRAVAFTGYWRRGASEDQFRSEAEAGDDSPTAG